MEPNTLQDAIVYFASPDNCREYLVAHRWPDGVTCPRCGSRKFCSVRSTTAGSAARSTPLRQFTSKTGTIFEDSPLGLDKWLPAMWLVVNCKNGISSYEIARGLGVTQKTAWFMDHRIRCALTWLLRKALWPRRSRRNFHRRQGPQHARSERQRRITGTGGKDKTAVMGILQRGGKVRTNVMPNRKKKALQAEVGKHVEAGSALYTDALLSYDGLAGEYAHQVVDHAVQYVDGKVHTNGLENFWSLLKRGINGTYVSVEPFHLFRYLRRADVPLQPSRHPEK